MRWRLSSVVMAVLVAAGALAASPASAVEEPADGIYVWESFEGQLADWTEPWVSASIGRRNRITSRSDGVDGRSIRVTIPVGEHYGSELRWRFWESGYEEPEQAWFRYYVRLDADGELGRGKLPGFTGLYSSSGRGNVPPSPSRPGWSARVQFDGGSGEEDSQAGYYVYHQDQLQNSGNGFPWANGISLGEWTCVEGQVSMNTPGVRDGSLVSWVDGTEVFRRSNLQFRASNEGFVGIESFWLAVYYGGAETAEVEHRFDFDELVVADRRVGCGAATAWGFEDVTDPIEREAVQLLRSLGVVEGCELGRFCVEDRVTEAAFTEMIERVAGRAGEVGGAVEPGTVRAALEAAMAPRRPTDLTRGEAAVLLVSEVPLPAPPWGGTFDAIASPGDDLTAVAEAAGPGGRVLLQPGAYLEASLTPLVGQEIIAAPGAVLDGAGKTAYGIAGIGVDGVTVRGVTTIGYTNAGIVTGSDWRIDECVATSNPSIGIAILGDRTMVQNCAFWGNGAAHVFVRDGVGVTIASNRFENLNADDRINPEASASVQASGVDQLRVVDNAMRSGSGRGVAVADSGTVLIMGNEIRDHAGGAVTALTTRSIRVSDNTLVGNGFSTSIDGAAIRTDAAIVFVIDNRLEDNRAGILYAPLEPNVVGWVSGNTLVSTGHSGIETLTGPSSPWLSWNRNVYLGSSATQWVTPQGLVDWQAWQELGADSASTVSG